MEAKKKKKTEVENIWAKIKEVKNLKGKSSRKREDKMAVRSMERRGWLLVDVGKPGLLPNEG